MPFSSHQAPLGHSFKSTSKTNHGAIGLSLGLFALFLLAFFPFQAFVLAEEKQSTSTLPATPKETAPVPPPGGGENLATSALVVDWSGYGGAIPSLDAGRYFNLQIHVTRKDGKPLTKQASIQMQAVADPKTFPFELERTYYLENIQTSGSGVTGEVSFGKLMVHPLSPPGYYNIPFTVTDVKEPGSKEPGSKEMVTCSLSLYVYVADSGQGEPIRDNRTAQTVPTQAPKETETTAPKTKNPLIQVKQGDVPRARYGDVVNVQIPLVNRGDDPIRIVTITPVISTDADSFPFILTQSDYTQMVNTYLFPAGSLAYPGYDGGSSMLVNYGNLQVRDDITTGYKKVDFKIECQLGDDAFTESIQSMYFYLQGKKDKEETEQTTEKPMPVPRIINEGFRTDPEKIQGGSKFTLYVTLKNTSKVTSVNNIRLNFAPVGNEKPFLPVNGASSLFLPEIGADESKEISLEFTSSATVQAGLYGLNLQIDYEDAKAHAFQASEEISLRIVQADRVDFTEFSLNPGEIMVGGEANLMFSILNKGKNPLSNASVLIPDDSPLVRQEFFVGNVEAGSSKEVDMMVQGKAASTPDKPIKITITYEDSEGTLKSIDKEFTLMITDPAGGMDKGPDGMGPGPDGKGPDGMGPDGMGPDGMGPDGMGPDGMGPDGKAPGFSWKLMGAGVGGGLLLIIAFIIWRKRHKEKKKLEEELALLQDEEAKASDPRTQYATAPYATGQDPRVDPRMDPRNQDPRMDPRYQDPRYQDPRNQDPRTQDPRGGFAR